MKLCIPLRTLTKLLHQLSIVPNVLFIIEFLNKQLLKNGQCLNLVVGSLSNYSIIVKDIDIVEILGKV